MRAARICRTIATLERGRTALARYAVYDIRDRMSSVGGLFDDDAPVATRNGLLWRQSL